MDQRTLFIILLVHAAATLFMVGVIWFVQLVHYPLFAAVGADSFNAYGRLHTGWTSLVVGPPMLVEALLSLMLVLEPPAALPKPGLWLGLALVAVLWLSTAFVQVPLHGILSQGFDTAVHARLVQTNWLRTILWTLRGGLALWFLLRLSER